MDELLEGQREALLTDDRNRFAAAILISEKTGARPGAILAALECHVGLGIEYEGTQPPAISQALLVNDDEVGDVFVVRFKRGGGLLVYPSPETRYSPIPDWTIDEL